MLKHGVTELFTIPKKLTLKYADSSSFACSYGSFTKMEWQQENYGQLYTTYINLSITVSNLTNICMYMSTTDRR